MSKINILFVIDSYKNPFAGTEGQLLKLVSGIDKKRYNARMVVFKSSSYLENNHFPIPVDVLNINRLVSLNSFIVLFNFFKKRKLEGFRLGHIFFNDASIICPPILKLLGYRVLVSRRDMGYWYNKLNLPLLKINSYWYRPLWQSVHLHRGQ